jgi:hypothetical protein
MSHKITTVITQSNYIPWLGYFDQLAQADHVVFLDDVQYTKRDWRNRNKIRTAQGLKWLTIPVDTKGKHACMRICEANITNPKIYIDHLSLLKQSYKTAPFFEEVIDFIAPALETVSLSSNLSQNNRFLIEAILRYLGIEKTFSTSSDHFSFNTLDHFSSTERLLKIAQKLKATHYVSGPAAKEYMDTSLFAAENIDIEWADYGEYSAYQQMHEDTEPFNPYVSIIDRLMMEGKKVKEQFRPYKDTYERTAYK